MTLAELIAALEAENPAKVLPHGFTRPHSYRGDYMDLSFEPASNITVAAMLADARSALGATFHGYKGGEYEMREYTDCWLAEYGRCGETIGPLLLKLMLANGTVADDLSPMSETPEAATCKCPPSCECSHSETAMPHG